MRVLHRCKLHHEWQCVESKPIKGIKDTISPAYKSLGVQFLVLFWAHLYNKTL